MKISIAQRLTPFVLGSALLVSGVNQAHAQTASNGLRVRTQKRVQTLFQSAGATVAGLNLSAVQKNKMRAIAQKNAPLIKAIWSDDSLPQNVKMSKIRALKNETSAILTLAQKQKIADAKSEAMGNLFTTALWISQELNLSPRQQGQIKTVVFNKYRQVSASNGEFGALRGLIIDTGGEIDQVLTPTQKAKWSVIKTTVRQEILKNSRVWRQLANV